MSVISALLEAEVGGSPEVMSLRPAWPTWWNSVSTRSIKISWAWWHRPVISATWEAEAGELLELWRLKLQWAKIAPLRSSLRQRKTLSQKKKERKKLIGSTLWERHCLRKERKKDYKGGKNYSFWVSDSKNPNSKRFSHISSSLILKISKPDTAKSDTYRDQFITYTCISGWIEDKREL